MRLSIAAVCLLAGPFPLAADALAQVPTTRFLGAVFDELQVTPDVQFGAAVNPASGALEALLLDVYEPEGDTAEARPAIVVVHGGGFVGGDKADWAPAKLASDLAATGFVTASINYRLAEEGSEVQPASILAARQDFQTAVRFLRENAEELRIDTERIAAIGSSAGGITALEGTYVQAPPAPGAPDQPADVAVVVNLWGQLQSLDAMEPGEAPVCAIHGVFDQTVPFEGSEALVATASSLGIPNVLYPLLAAHAPWPLFFDEHFDDVLNFVFEHMRLGQLAGLVLRPGFSSPGLLELDSFGVAGSVRQLGLALDVDPVPLPPLGTLWLDLDSLLLFPASVLPTQPDVASVSTVVAVPSGLAGVGVVFQEVQLSTDGGVSLLTNPVLAEF